MTRKIWANKVPPELEFTQYVAVEDGNQSICNMVSLKMWYVILKQIQRFRMFYPSTSLAWLQGDYTQNSVTDRKERPCKEIKGNLWLFIQAGKTFGIPYTLNNVHKR